MKLIWHWIISALALLIVAWLFNGIWFDTIGAAFVTALVLGLLNTFIRPVLKLLALPLTILTLGIFALVINAVMLLITSHFVSGFHVDGFFTAFFGSIVLSVISGIMYAVLED
jgi:putative membrane protein